MYTGSADIAYVITKIKEATSQISSFISEITTARGGKPSLNDRITDVAGSVPIFSGAKKLKTTSQTGLVNNVSTKLTFDSSEYDVTSWWDAVNLRFVVPAEVDYVNITCQADIQDDSGYQTVESLQLYKDGVLYREAKHSHNSDTLGMWSACLSEDILVTVGTYFELYALCSNSSTNTWKILKGSFSIRALG